MSTDSFISNSTSRPELSSREHREEKKPMRAITMSHRIRGVSVESCSSSVCSYSDSIGSDDSNTLSYTDKTLDDEMKYQSRWSAPHYSSNDSSSESSKYSAKPINFRSSKFSYYGRRHKKYDEELRIHRKNHAYKTRCIPSQVLCSSYCRNCDCDDCLLLNDAHPNKRRRYDERYHETLHQDKSYYLQDSSIYSTNLCAENKVSPIDFTTNTSYLQDRSNDDGDDNYTTTSSSFFSSEKALSTPINVHVSDKNNGSFSNAYCVPPSSTTTTIPSIHTTTTDYPNTPCPSSSSSTTILDSSHIVTSTISPTRQYKDLPLEFWDRSPECKEAKCTHMDRIDRFMDSRERLVLLTTLWKEDTVLEKNMFPYDTPVGIEHYTLWSIHDLSHTDIVTYVDNWLTIHMPHVKRWQYDDNAGERSVLLFHVHVYIETIPYSYITPSPEKLYVPEHVLLLQETSAPLVTSHVTQQPPVPPVTYVLEAVDTMSTSSTDTLSSMYSINNTTITTTNISTDSTMNTIDSIK